jgi:hypothetical protein
MAYSLPFADSQDVTGFIEMQLVSIATEQQPCSQRSNDPNEVPNIDSIDNGPTSAKQPAGVVCDPAPHADTVSSTGPDHQLDAADLAGHDRSASHTVNDTSNTERIIQSVAHEFEAYEQRSLPGESFVEALREYMPEESVLMRCIERRQTRAWLMDGKSFPTTPISLSTLGTRLGELSTQPARANDCVLVLGDINPSWAQKLLSEFPQSVHHLFLAQNMMRFDSGSVTDEAIKGLELDFLKKSPASRLAFNHDYDSLKWTISGFPPPATETKGFHVDCDIRAMMRFGFERSGTAVRRLVGLRSDSFEKDFWGDWRRTSTRLSVCQLEAQLCKDGLGRQV